VRGRVGWPQVETLGPFSSREKVPTDEGTTARQESLVNVSPLFVAHPQLPELIPATQIAAFAYELISQLSDTTSNSGLVHSMRIVTSFPTLQDLI